jgi:hypothetical protein
MQWRSSIMFVGMEAEFTRSLLRKSLALIGILSGEGLLDASPLCTFYALIGN